MFIFLFIFLKNDVECFVYKAELINLTAGMLLQFLIGVGVGIYGYLMPGYINLGIFRLSLLHHRSAIVRILWLISLLEIPYCFVCMSGMQWFMQQDWLLVLIRWLIVVALLMMAFFTYRDSQDSANQPEENTQDTNAPAMKKLLLFAIFNPFQISAWAIWGAYFIEKSWFEWHSWSILIFSLGSFLGVFLILSLYAYAGKKLVQYFQVNRRRIDIFSAVFFVILAIYQSYRNCFV